MVTILESKKKNQMADVLEKITSDLDVQALGQLIYYSKEHATAIAPPAALHVSVSLFKHDRNGGLEESSRLDNVLRTCNSKFLWETCLRLVREDGVLTKRLLECVWQVRMNWCDKLNALIASREDPQMCNEIVDEMKSMCYKIVLASTV
jgi:hypothetical protein